MMSERDCSNYTVVEKCMAAILYVLCVSGISERDWLSWRASLGEDNKENGTEEHSVGCIKNIAIHIHKNGDEDRHSEIYSTLNVTFGSCRLQLPLMACHCSFCIFT